MAAQSVLAEPDVDPCGPTVHTQVRVSYGENTALVDEDLYGLILGCWRLGIDTMMSCQDNAGPAPLGTVRRVWLSFSHAEEGQRFLDALFPAALADTDAPRLTEAESEAPALTPEGAQIVDGFRNRVVPEWDADDHQAFRENRIWHYRADLMDFNGNPEIGPDGGRRPWPVLGLSVRFPHTDLAEVEHRLRLAFDER